MDKSATDIGLVQDIRGLNKLRQLSTGNDTNQQKALEAADVMTVKPSEVLYLGDTATDMDTARAAGMFAVGASWGFRPVEELLAHGAQAVVHHQRELAALIG